MLAYRTSADQLDDLTRMAKSTTLHNLKVFCNSIISRYGQEYLRAPTKDYMEMVLCLHEAKGWPRLLGSSLDVMQWEWKNCSNAHRGAFQGKDEVATVALEAAVDCRLWFWHAWFGMPGANNDLNILDRSPFFRDLTAGRTPAVNFTINNKEHNLGYYLVDGIYPDWHIFVKTISEPQGAKRAHFSNGSRGSTQGHRASICCATSKVEDPGASVQTLVSGCNESCHHCMYHNTQHD